MRVLSLTNVFFAPPCAIGLALCFTTACGDATSGTSGGDDGGDGLYDGGGYGEGGDSGTGGGAHLDGGTGGRDAGVHDGGASGDGGGSHTGQDAGSGGDDGGGGGGDVDAGDPLQAARAQCVQIINMYRATLNPASPALTEATSSEACVDTQAHADYTANTPHSAFGTCQEWAQDECPGWTGPPMSANTTCFAEMWAEGPPPAGQDNHWLNMSNPSYTKVACGYYQDPAGSWWTTQDFYY